MNRRISEKRPCCFRGQRWSGRRDAFCPSLRRAGRLPATRPAVAATRARFCESKPLMPMTTSPEILSPRFRRGSRAFDDESLDILSHLLDDWFRIPGTSIRFGLDGIIGFIPGIGDILGGVASCIIIVAAWARGVSYVTIARMLVNWGIEVGLGVVPVLGNVFDIGWKANRRNYALLTSSLADPKGVARRSWFFFAGLCVALVTLLLVPMFLFTWISIKLGHRIGLH